MRQYQTTDIPPNMKGRVFIMNENEFEKKVSEEEQAQWSEPSDHPTENVDVALIDRIKELVKKGNVTKIVIKKDDNVLVNIPVNVGIVGGIIGVAAAPWAVVAAAVATAGFACRVELVKEDGEITVISGKAIETKAKDLGDKAVELGKGLGAKAKDVGASVMEGIKEAVAGEAQETDFASIVEETETAAAPEPEEAPAVEIPVEDGPKE